MRGALPKYLLIKAILADRLERDYAPGDRIPSEAELCADFGVSRITIQQALDQLQKDGLIRREQGRGTFYLGPPAPRTETKPSELLEKVMKYREGAFTRVLRHGVQRAAPRIAAHLGLEQGATVIAIDRLSFVDDQPIAFTEAFLPEALGAKIMPDLDLLRQHTLASLLKDRHGIEVDAVVQTIGAALADPRFAFHLGIEVGAPVITGERTYFNVAGRPIFVSQTFYRADRHRFVVTLKEWR